jgi:hypothetical protein
MLWWQEFPEWLTMIDNRFTRHPFITFLAIMAFLVLIAEFTLRLVGPDILEFAYNFRQVYRYHDRWYTDFEPGSATRIALKDSSGSYFFNFLITINEYGFKDHDRRLDSHLTPGKGEKIIHTIGDSFTMGWGVGNDSSYPAILNFNLPQEYRVLNLGLNGFGTIAATEKSMIIGRQFAPVIVVYLATENDYSDDERAVVHSRRPSLVHGYYKILNWLRQHTYVVSAPFALYWWTYYRGSIVTKAKDFVENKHLHRFVSTNFKLQNDPSSVSDPRMGEYSKSALLKYSEFLKKSGVHFLVVLHGTGKVVKDLFAFCREHQIDACLIEVPSVFKLARDGHFNLLGNYRLAEFVRNKLVKRNWIKLEKPNN